jgi:hypothetical protein
MLPYDDIITITRKDSVGWNKATIYESIKADVQINSKWDDGWDNSDNSERADFFVFVEKDKTNVKIGDIIEYTDDFGDDVLLSVSSRDFIDFSDYEPFIEILCKKL